jgi:hypothetical protein
VNIVGTGPLQPFVTVSPYSPLGKPAVGLESPDTKDKPLPPVEETEASTRPAQHRIGEEAEDGAGHDEREREQAGAEPAVDDAPAEPGSAAADPNLAELQANALAAELTMRARIDQALSAEPAAAPAGAPRGLPPGGFDIGADEATGTLFDQKI